MVLSWEMAELLHKVLNLSVHYYVHHGAQNYFVFKISSNHKIYFLRTQQLNLQSLRTILNFYSILSSVLVRTGVICGWPIQSEWKKNRFLSHEMFRRHNVAFSAIFRQKQPRVAIFWPNFFSKIPKIFQKILNCLKIILEQKEKRFWKALCPNKLICY